MLIDLAKLRATVRFRGDYQNVKKFPSSDVNTEIQGAFGEFWELIANVHEGHWDTSAQVSTIVDQAYVALPVGTWRVQGIDRLDGSDWFPLTKVSVAKRNRFGSQTDTPSAYRLSARGAELYATPNAVITLRVMYTPSAPLLQEAGERDWFNGWEEFVIVSTLLRLARLDKQPLKDFIDAVDAAAKRITSGAGEREASEPEYLNLHEGGSVDIWDRSLE